MTSLTQGKEYHDVVISSSGTVSTAASLNDFTLCGFILPAAFTGAAVTFQGSVDNVTFSTIYDSSDAAIGATVTQGRAYSLNLIDFLGYPYIKIVSGSAEGAERTIQLLSVRSLNNR